MACSWTMLGGPPKLPKEVAQALAGAPQGRGRASDIAYSRRLHTCSRLLFRTDTNDLTGGMRCGAGAVVISDTRALSSKRDRQDGGAARSPTAAAEPPTPLQPRGPTGDCCGAVASGCGPPILPVPL